MDLSRRAPRHIPFNVGTCPAIKQFLSALGSQALTNLSRRGGMSRARIAVDSGTLMQAPRAYKA